MFIVAWITYVPIKLLITFGSLTIATLYGYIANYRSDPKKPLSPVRFKFFDIGNAILGRILCIGHGLFIIQKNKHLRDKKADVMVGNHCSYLDAMVMSTVGGGSAVVN